MAVDLVDVVNPETGKITTVSATSDAATEWKRPPSQRDALPTTFDNTTPADLEAAAQADDTPPGGGASRDEWVAYARSQGASDEDLVDDDGKPLTRDQIRDTYSKEN